MTFNISPNWAEIARVAKALGGFATALGVSLGALTPALAPLAGVLPGVAPLAGVIATAGLLLHGLATGSKALLETLEAQGLINTGPK